MRHAWLLALVGGLGLTALGVAYWLTYEPAPAIQIRWRGGITSARKAELERKYLLVDPYPETGHYTLLDTSRRNIEALVNDPDVADTQDIDREQFVVPFHVAYGSEWMWVAHRIPLLRSAWFRGTLIALLAGMTVAGAAGVWRATRRSPS